MTTHTPTVDLNARGHGLISDALVTVEGIDSVIKGEAMSRLRLHTEHHLVDRIGWLRAADSGQRWHRLDCQPHRRRCRGGGDAERCLDRGYRRSGCWRLSMAAGEYVSVSSQSDTEQADLARERKELRDDAAFELDELTEIYVKRGVDQAVARQVAQQLMTKDALAAHARDELGISAATAARPVQAALTSAASFSVGAAMPLLMVVVSPTGSLVPIVSGASLPFSLSWARSEQAQEVQTLCAPPPE